MHTILLRLSRRTYKIIIGKRILPLLGGYIRKVGIGSSAYCITNSLISRRYAKALEQALTSCGIEAKFRLVADTEKSKSLTTAAALLRDISRYDKRRRVFIIAFGGGVIGDLSGFVASVYKRGIPYIQVPTTLLAQVDSSIGGKTGLDLAEGKNLVGAFYQPKLVFSDVSLLKSLKPRQVESGLAEVIKYGVIRDPGLFAFLEKQYKRLLALDENALEFTVRSSSSIKAKIVRQDEREEKGIRTILNFGHTLGHALEAATRYSRYSHGEAIALGMLLASDISSELHLLKGATVAQRIERLISKVGLPTRIRGVSLDSIIRAHYADKKFIGSRNRFVLIEDIACLRIVEDVPIELIRKVLKGRM